MKKEIFLALLGSRKPFGKAIEAEKFIALYIKNVDKLTKKKKETYGEQMITDMIEALKQQKSG